MSLSSDSPRIRDLPTLPLRKVSYFGTFSWWIEENSSAKHSAAVELGVPRFLGAAQRLSNRCRLKDS
jgi:hypothetical protein